MSAMARACGANPAQMTCADGQDLADYLRAADAGRRPWLGLRLVVDRIWEG